MAANAATVYVYRQIFQEDFLKEAQAKEPDPTIFQKIGFVMAMQAEKKDIGDLMKLTQKDFFVWLSQFGPMDLLECSNEIMNLYLGQGKQLSVPKSEGD